MLEKLIANKISDVKSKIVELKSEDKEFSATTLVEKVSCLVLKKGCQKNGQCDAQVADYHRFKCFQSWYFLNSENG